MLRLMIVVICLTLSFSGNADTDVRGDLSKAEVYHGVQAKGEKAKFKNVSEVVSASDMKHLQSVVAIANSRSSLVDRMNANGMSMSQMGKEHKGGAE